MQTFMNSARTKLKLLMSGIMIEPKALSGLGKEYKEYQYGYNDSNWAKKEKQEIIPSELVLQGDIVVAPHIRPNSPYLIITKEDTTCILFIH